MGLVYQVYCELVALGSQFPVLKHKCFHYKLANNCTKIPLEYVGRTVTHKQTSWENIFQHMCCFIKLELCLVCWKNNRVKPTKGKVGYISLHTSPS